MNATMRASGDSAGETTESVKLVICWYFSSCLGERRIGNGSTAIIAIAAAMAAMMTVRFGRLPFIAVFFQSGWFFLWWFSATAVQWRGLIGRQGSAGTRPERRFKPGVDGGLRAASWTARRTI